jgi:hypothetical protein
MEVALSCDRWKYVQSVYSRVTAVDGAPVTGVLVAAGLFDDPCLMVTF